MNDAGSGSRAAGLESGAVVTFILRQPGMLPRLLAQHVDDGRGRCRVCSSAGARHVWPCSIRAYADLAAAAMERAASRRKAPGS